MSINLRLLMVEDSEDDAELIRIELERAGYQLDWKRVDTEDEFLSALEEPWDLIISDFMMPTFDGLRAFALFAERHIDTPFIYVSGALGEDRAVEAMRAGARDYLLKGNLARLAGAVRRELEEAASRVARRAADASTERERTRLSIAVEASGAGVFDHAIPMGPDTYHSERWAEILGYTRAELPGYEQFFEWRSERVHPDDVDATLRAKEEFLAGRTDRYAVEARMRHKAGHWVEVATFAKADERGPDGRATHVVGVILDQSERKTLEQQLRQAQKMEAVGRLAGGVAHDFNNLLTVIFSFGSFVLDELDKDGPAFSDMEEVLKAAARAETLTAQLLAFSRRKPISPVNISINDLVQDTDRMLRRVVGEDVDVSTRLAPDLWTVRMDPGSLEQVILNLAVNARDAMLEGGKLTIETDNVELSEAFGRQYGASIRPGQYVVLAISDDGVGMDEDTRRSIFEPFFTTKEAGKGTGLGLSTCYGIVKQAEGYIWAYSELGNGTTFKIYLPRVAQEADEVALRVEPVSLQGTETILVAEDDDQVRSIAARALAQLGYRVIEASNGVDAIRQCESCPDTIDLLLTDVVMPGMNGKQLVENLTALRPEIKVLFMSGYTANAIVHRGVLDPGTNMLHKPFTPDALARKIRAVLDE